MIPNQSNPPATKADVQLILGAISALDRARSRDVKKLEKLIVATQNDIDAVTAALVQEDSDLSTPLSPA